MGSFVIKCHLSGLVIEEGDEIIAVPTVFNHFRTTPNVYSPKNDIYPTTGTINGVYDGYGNFNIANNISQTLSILKKHVETNLFHNLTEKNKNQFFYGMNTCFAFKDSGHNDPVHSQFIDFTILEEFSKPETTTLLKITEFKDDQQFIDYFSYLVSNSHPLSKYGFIIIRKDFFNKLIKKSYKKEKTLIQKNIIELLNDFSKNVVSENQIMDAFLLFNANDKILENGLITAFNLFKKIIKDENSLKDVVSNSTFKNYLNEITNLALIAKIYNDLDKSFYQNTNTSGSFKKLYDFNDLLKSEMDNKLEKNIKELKNEGFSAREINYEKWI